ncbi:MAG: type II toxin-antitoxin system VapC family toxin [Actinomycetota bacterium]
MIVIDASVLANALADDAVDGQAARHELRIARGIAAPDLVDVETTAVLRRRWLRGTLPEERFRSAIAALVQLPFERVPTLRLVPRAVELRATVSAYDACYVALAELLGCALLTGDGRLATAPGPRCPIRVLRPSAAGPPRG